jgi:hypothetical protein
MRFLIIVLAVIVGGCQDKNPGGSRVKPPAQSADGANKHNFRKQTVGKWQVEVWTSGSAFLPGAPVDITLRLYSPEKKQTGPTILMDATLTRQDNGKKGAERKLKVTFLAKEDEDRAWEGTVSDVFQTAPAPKRSEANAMELGDYVMAVEVGLENGERAEFKDMPMTFFVRR